MSEQRSRSEERGEGVAAADSASGGRAMEELARQRHRRAIRSGLQVVGFAVGVALLVWAVKIVLAPENREMLDRLRDASTGQALLLAGLCAATVLLNGGCFWLVVRPVKRLRFVDLQATNAVACMLAPLPFKLSVIFRVFVHTARDRMAILTIGAWFACFGLLVVMTYAPVLLAGWWRQRADAMWAAAALVGVAASMGAVVVAAGWFGVESRWNGLTGWVLRLPWPGVVRRVLSGLIARGHEGVRMLSHGGIVFGSAGLRLADIGVHTARFVLAASILGLALPVDQAVLAGSAFFLIGMLWPAGQVGFREAGTAGMLSLIFPEIDFKPFMVVVTLISATELLTLLVMGAAGLAWLRPGGMRWEAAERRRGKAAE